MVDFQQFILTVFLGIGTFIAVYISWGTYVRRSRREFREEEDLDASYEPGKADNPIPRFLIFLIVALFFWIISYFIFYGVHGEAIG